MKVFLSYSTKDKHAAANIKNTLTKANFDCFLAHEDLQVSEKWKERILEELSTCDVFIPVLSKNFKESEWAPQEIGIITARPHVPIVPLSLDETIPFGFISNIQGQLLQPHGLDIDKILNTISKTYPRLVIPTMIDRVRSAKSFSSAEAAMQPLVQHFSRLTDSEFVEIINASIENCQVWKALLCRTKYLPELIKNHRGRIEAEKLKALEYQIINDCWYN